MSAEMNTVPRFEIRPLSEIEGGGYLVEFPEIPDAWRTAIRRSARWKKASMR